MSKLTTILTLLAALALAGCAPEDQDAELKRQLEEQARQRPPRASMSFGYIHGFDGVDEGGPVQVTTEAGAEIELQEAYLVVSALEAHLCEPEIAESGFLDPVERLFIGEAFAHVPSSATRLGTPFVEDLFSPGRARIVGEISPPLGEYCRIFAVVSPADDDVLNLTAVDTAEIEGQSLLLRGRWRESAEGSWQAFSSASAAREAVELDAIDPHTGAHPLELSDPSQSVMVLLDKTIGPELFAGLTPEQLDGSAAADLVLERIERSFRIREFQDP